MIQKRAAMIRVSVLINKTITTEKNEVIAS